VLIFPVLLGRAGEGCRKVGIGTSKCTKLHDVQRQCHFGLKRRMPNGRASGG
jgi:hypothetical protein